MHLTASQSPKISLIISVYKNTRFLEAVLNTLKAQTFSDFEVIISEDGESTEMKEFLLSVTHNYPLRHLTQKDLGWRKNRALNRAIEASAANWLVFIDGDCVLHPRFLELHWKLADEKMILAGKRVKLDPMTTEDLLQSSIGIEEMNRKILTNFSQMKNRGGEFLEEGVFINPEGLLSFLARVRKMRHLKGCNMSFHINAIRAINGFDEEYTKPAVGEDADLLWRFQGMGYQLKSVRNLAVQYHLYHKESWTDQKENLKRMKKNQADSRFICQNGLEKNNVN